jgi:molybdopterin/thiamine biosynthesis adenylyltransferase
MIQNPKNISELLKIWERQIPLFEAGTADQKRLLTSRITVVGAGGLGSAFLLYAAAAGIGSIQIIDYQTVEISNLNRQIIYGYRDIGKPKAEIAAMRIKEINPLMNAFAFASRLEESLEDIRKFEPQLLVDCTDNLEARFTLNRLSLEIGIPLVYAMVRGYEGILGAVYPKKGPCLCCWLSEKTPKEKTPPVIGFAPGVLGCLESALAVQLLLGSSPLVNEILHLNLENFEFSKLKVSKNERCACCGSKS